MIDDLKGDLSGSSHFELSSHAESILKYRTNRTHATQWARNSRFLTFDDGRAAVSHENIVESDDEELSTKGQCSRCNLRIPPAAGHLCSSHLYSYQSSIEARENRLREYSNPCVHVEEHSCEECLHIPLFPNQGKVTRFRMRRLRPKDTKPSKLSTCTHFVAVSYCWPSEVAQTKGNSEDQSYLVLEEDLTVRPIRTPKDIIDRAVDFAVQNGFRMIWIDQECIEQDNEEEKELGVQAMDVVYLRAHTSIGLFRTVFDQQRHLDALLLFFEWRMGASLGRRGPRPSKKFGVMHLESLAEALSMIANDRWNTRAWILQEAFASSGNMILLFPRAKNINVKGWSLICHDMSFTDIAIQLDFLHQCVSESIAFFSESGQENPAIKLEGWESTLDRLQWFHPRMGPSPILNFSVEDFKTRRTCNAAVALSFLRDRNNSLVADRLAIIANLCNYRIRLDTVKLGKSQHRLSTCILMLALMNGDFSLLLPEVYHLPQEWYPACSNRNSDFSWVPDDVKRLNNVVAKVLNPGGATAGQNNTTSYHVSDQGFSFPGSLWKIDEFIDLNQIKENYEESWSRLRYLNKICTGREPETMKGRYSNHMPEEIIAAQHLAMTHMLFEMLILLRAKEQIEIADAIWQSVLSIHWRPTGKELTNDMIESVLDFPEELKIEDCHSMFHLERGRHGGFNHYWLIDRIMDQGGLWLGRLVRTSSESEYNMPPTWRSVAEKNVEDERRSLDDLSCSPTLEPGQESGATNGPRVAENLGVDAQPGLKKNSHFTQQLVSSLIRLSAEKIQSTDDDANINRGNNFNSATSTITPEAFAHFAYLCSRLETSDEPLRQQRAIFDVDGDTSGQVLVLTPFNQHYETIPRSDTRSMSVSWVVDPVVQENVVENVKVHDRDISETLKSKGMVRGMWKFMSSPITVYNLL